MSRDLHEAAAEGDLQALLELLDEGVGIDSLNPYQGSALMIVARRGRRSIVEALLARGANPDLTLCPPGDPKQTYTALHTAAQEGHSRIATMLLASGADVNSATGYGETPLISAAVHGKRDTIRILLKHGADPAMRTVEGKTAADYALRKGHLLTWLALRGEK